MTAVEPRSGPRTVRARLTLWYTIVLAIPLIVFALASYFIFARTLINRTDSFIRDGLQVFAPSGHPFRFPAWSVRRVLRPWIVRRGIYKGVRSS